MSNGRNLGLLLGTSTVVPASALTEVLNLVDSDYVTQLSPVKITTANQSFDSNQETLLNLTSEISGVPNVAVFKEVPQTGITSKSNWDVNSTASNYDFYNEATTLYSGISITPSNSSTDGIFTLSTGTFVPQDVGKRVVGNGGEAIITATDGSYSLVTPFNDTSTITSGNWSLYGLAGNADGIKLNEVSSPISDITTATYTGKYYDPLFGSTGIDLSPDGSKLFILSNANSTLYRYDLTTPYDLTTASNPTTFSTSFMSNESGVRFKPDGTRVWLCDYGVGVDAIFQRNLSTPWDLSTISGTGSVGFNSGSYGQVSTTNSNPFDIAWSSDGTYFYTPLYDNAPYKQVDQYSVSTPWDLTSTKTHIATLNLQTTPNVVPQSIDFNSDGTILLVANNASLVYQFALSTPWMLSSASYSNQFIDFDTVSSSATSSSSYGIRLKKSDTRLYMMQNNVSLSRQIPHEYSVGSSLTVTSQYIPAITNSIGRINTTSWLDINDMTPDETLNDGEVYYAISTDARTTWKVAKNGEGERSIARNNSGTWQYNSNANETTVYTGYDLDGNLASTLSSFTSISGDTGVTYLGTGFSSDGTNMYAFSPTDYTFYQFTLSTPWDETTASYANKSFTPSSGNNWQVHLIRFDPTGTKMYAGGQGQTRNTLYEYTLSTPWDISTANPTATDSLPTLNVAGVTGEVENIIISPNGSYVYALNYQTGTLHRWTLNTAWNLSSRTSNSPDQTTSSLYTWSTFSWGLDISDDGTKLYVTNGNPVGLGEWSLSPAYSISGLSTSPNTSSAWSGAAYKNLVIGKQGLKLYATGAGGVAHQDMGNSSISSVYGLTETWTNSTYNNEHAALQQALTVSINRMNSTQLSELSDANEFVLGNSLDLMIAPYVSSGASPVSDGVTINYDAEAIIRQAILGTDYIVEQPTPGTIKVVSLTNQNLKIRVL